MGRGEASTACIHYGFVDLDLPMLIGRVMLETLYPDRAARLREPDSGSLRAVSLTQPCAATNARPPTTAATWAAMQHSGSVFGLSG